MPPPRHSPKGSSSRHRRRPGTPSLLATLLLLPAAGVRGFAPPVTPEDTRTVEGWMRRMTLEEKVAQMNHVPIRAILADPETNPTLDRAKLRAVFQKLPAGLIANTIFDGGIKGNKSGWTAAEWRELIGGIQEEARALGMPPVLYAIDHVHGSNYVINGTIFPQQINLAATFNLGLARDWGRITGKDTKAAGPAQVFAPILDLQQQPLWSRTYETFGEDPYLTAQMGRAVIEGIQGPDPRFPDLPPAAATMKHWLGYGNGRTGHDRSPVDATDRQVRNYYLPAFREAVRAGVKAAMSAYIEIDGVPMVANRAYTIDLLRHDLGWQGVLKPDYMEAPRLYTWHSVANSSREAVRLALADGSTDQFTSSPDFPDDMLALVKAGVIPESRIDASVRRVLQAKQSLGLLDDPVRANVFATPGLLESVGSAEDRAVSLEVARESIVLLKNERASNQSKPVLPLRKGTRLLVVGQGCDSLSHQIGGWSIHWQGAEDWEFPYGTTIYQALTERLGAANLTLLVDAQKEDGDKDGDGELDDAPDEGVEGNNGNGSSSRHGHRRRPPRRNLELARSIDVDAVVACVGEHPYAEKPGDIDSLALDEEQIAVVKDLKEQTGKPLVVVLVEGRTRLLRGLPDVSDAVVHAMLPGPFGGQAVAEVLLGEVNPSGRLPVTYPKRSGTALHSYYGLVTEKCTNPVDGFDIIDCPVEWPFGAGLSYTSFTYSKPTLSSARITERDTLTVRVTVTNTGSVPGKDALLLFVTDVVRRVTPEAKLLKRFAKSPLLAPGESWTYETVLHPKEDLSYWGLAEGEDPLKSREILEAGLFYLAVGPDADCRATDEGKRKGCVPFELALTDGYDPGCAAACRVWWRAVNETAAAAAVGVGCPVGGEEAWSMAAVARSVFGGAVGAVEEGDEAAALAACETRWCGPKGQQHADQQRWDWPYVTCLERELYGERACGMAAVCGGLEQALSLPPPPHKRHWLSLAGANATAGAAGAGEKAKAASTPKAAQRPPAAVQQPEQASLRAHESQGQPAQLSSAAVALAFAGGMAAGVVALGMAYIVRVGMNRLGWGMGADRGSVVDGAHQRSLSSSVIRV